MAKKKSPDGGYGVGYGRPPRKTQFAPGTSGNPKGRPKDAKNFATVFDQELSSRVPVTENGKRKKISKREAIGKQIVNKAANGDLKAAQTVLNEAKSIETSRETGAGAVFSVRPEDQPVMANIVKRIRQMEEPADDEPNTPDTNPTPKQEGTS